MTIDGGLPARCYVIAEAGSNHDGDLTVAHRLVDAAADSDADAVKFQLFRAASLYPPNCGEVDTPIGKVELFQLLQAMELPAAWLTELSSHASDRGIDFLCTPFDAEGVATLDALNVRALKVASPELTHHELLREIAHTARSVILSTGMSTLGDIEESIQVLRGAGADDISLLQCVTAYPTPIEDLHLGAIPVLATAFGVRVGLSDHSLDPVLAPTLCVALGGSIIEKHFTLSRESGTGPDHPFALEPDQLAELVEAVRTVEALPEADRRAWVEERHGAATVEDAIGERAKVLSDAELELAACDRRAIHALRDIAPGEALDTTNVRVLRGERNLRPGLHPRHLPTILGASATRAIAAGDGVVWEDLLS
jgi:N-acetylneuraminate synthase